jgi:hypothetical protein
MHFARSPRPAKPSETATRTCYAEILGGTLEIELRVLDESENQPQT